jgi:uncharacterized membrane protein YfcA
MIVFLEIFTAALIAGSLDTVAGFGGGLLLMPVLVLVMGSVDAVLVAPIIFLGWNIPRVVLLRESINWKSVLLFSIGIVPGTLVGTMLLKSIDPSLLQTAIALLLILFGAYYLLRLYAELPSLRRLSGWALPLIGFVSAVIGAILGAGHGPLQSIALSASALTPHAIAATNGALGGVSSIVRIGVYLIEGLLTSTIWTLGLVGAAGGWLGGVLGVRISRRTKDSTLELMIAVLLIIAGIRMLL